MSAELASRQHFGRYETLFQIARGGMAEVHAARHLGEAGFQKIVALKCMRAELTEDARFVTMFLDEGRMAANISSPNVVSTLDLGRADDNSLFLVMELVTGVSLHMLIREMKLTQEWIPVPLAVEVVAQAANGLHDAHLARSPAGDLLGIVHRDCSPHNILVDVSGRVLITDFGIAKAMERQTQSQAGEMKGKLSYLSPEQARGLPVEPRSDIFILGIVAWEILTRTRLFEGENAMEILHKISSEPIPTPHQIRPTEVSEPLSAAVMQALERDPAERYATAGAFGNALVNAIGGRRPPREELGEFVRRMGGDELHHLQNGLREALGGSPLPPADAEYPIPLVERTERTTEKMDAAYEESLAREAEESRAREEESRVQAQESFAQEPVGPGSGARVASPQTVDGAPSFSKPTRNPPAESIPAPPMSRSMTFGGIAIVALLVVAGGAIGIWWLLTAL